MGPGSWTVMVEGERALVEGEENVSAARAPFFRWLPGWRRIAAMKATRTTEEIWAKRVEEWRASGDTADAFARGKGYQASTLHGWSSRLGRAETPRFVQLVRKAGAAPVDAGVVVEVGLARIRVKEGFDARLLAKVVAVLGGDR